MPRICRRRICRPASGGGCRSRRLLAVRRPVWLLDEPTSALDTAGQDLFAGLMRDHLAGGGIIIAATHCPARDRNEGTADGGAA